MISTAALILTVFFGLAALAWGSFRLGRRVEIAELERLAKLHAPLVAAQVVATEKAKTAEAIAALVYARRSTDPAFAPLAREIERLAMQLRAQANAADVDQDGRAS